MAEPLKNRFGTDVPERIAQMILAVSPGFPASAFIRDALEGYEALDLMPRGRKIADALRRHLAPAYEAAVATLVASLGPTASVNAGAGMAPFLYLPHVCFVERYGLDHFEASMAAQHAMTQRFTAEFSIRPFLVRHRDATLKRLAQWVRDDSPHVRRLVSEGTRPRLPWAPRLREFQQDPRPVLALLEHLKDDPEPYVRRSVANNLNDIGKDHPALLVDTARRWLQDAGPERRWLVSHALRSAIKRAEAGALELMGAADTAQVAIGAIHILPARPRIGDSVVIALAVTNITDRRQRILADLRVHFIKASGKAAPKVFKLKTFELGPGETMSLRKRLSLAEMTTRRHYAGMHAVEVMLNGLPHPLGQFELVGDDVG